MTASKLPMALVVTTLTISLAFSYAGSWSGIERAFVEPGRQSLKSETTSIIITTDNPEPVFYPTKQATD